MTKYLKFIKDVYDENKLIWEKDKKYLVTFEDDITYFLEEPKGYGIEKNIENDYFIVEEIEND